MDLEDLSLKAHSLLRKAGLAQVSTPVVVGTILLGLVLFLAGLWHFWPRAHADFSSAQAVASQGAGSGFRAASGSSAAGATEALDETEIMVDVEGAVQAPGLYALAPDARIGDAVEAAGGMLEDALPGSINLAQKLADGDQVYIPNVQDQESAGALASSMETSGATHGTTSVAPDMSNAPKNAADKVNINTASAEELQQLSGIGPSLSQRIVEHRQSKGRFLSIDDLKSVSGIGDAKFASIKDKICV